MDSNYDVIVIGAGPAGVSAAIYATSRGKRVLVLEQAQVGGLIGKVSTVTHYTALNEDETGATFAARLARQLDECGAELRLEKVTGVQLAGEQKAVTTAAGTYTARAVVLANGGTGRKLGIPGEAQLAGKGMDMNAARDAAAYAGKDVYVIGGADGAAKEAIFLAKTAKHVEIVCVEPALACIAQFRNVIAGLSNVSVRPQSKLVEVKGTDHVEALVFSDLEGNNRVEVADDGCGVFVYAGVTPNTGLYGEVALTEDGHIQVNERMETSVPGVFAAGDIRKKQVCQVATAVSDGAVAGINAAAY